MSDEKTVTEREAIRRERKAFVNGAQWRYLYGKQDGPQHEDTLSAAHASYPLPAVTRPRVIADPSLREGAGYYRAFRCIEGKIQQLASPTGQWEDAYIHMTVERMVALADLLAHPTETVSDDEDAT